MFGLNSSSVIVNDETTAYVFSLPVDEKGEGITDDCIFAYPDNEGLDEDILELLNEAGYIIRRVDITSTIRMCDSLVKARREYLEEKRQLQLQLENQLHRVKLMREYKEALESKNTELEEENKRIRMELSHWHETARNKEQTNECLAKELLRYQEQEEANKNTEKPGEGGQ